MPPAAIEKSVLRLREVRRFRDRDQARYLTLV
jgi:hypothetical protein